MERLRGLVDMAATATPETRSRIVRAIEHELDKATSEYLGVLFLPEGDGIAGVMPAGNNHEKSGEE